MPYSNSIKKILGIKDPNIFIYEVTQEMVHNVHSTVVYGHLTKELTQCPLCKIRNRNHMIVKNGNKYSQILLNKAGNQVTYLKLKKQRYFCRGCHKFFTAETYLVDKYCFIAKQVHFKVLDELTENQTGKNIAKHCHISSTTLQRTLNSLESQIKPKLSWLPNCLLFDEFSSLKDDYGKYSFSCMNGDTGKVFDILKSRRKKDLLEYFLKFDLKARQNVRYVVTDMNAPYFSVMKECFPNAQLIVDRFHVVQHLNKCFDQLRKKVMKRLNRNDSKEGKMYRQLKSLHRLLLKDKDTLNTQTYHRRRNFKWTPLTDSEVVDRLLSISEDLKKGYDFYQQLLQAFHSKNTNEFYSLLNHIPEEVPRELRPLKFTFNKYKTGITLAMQLPYNNAKLENLHTHIKNLKRTLYGFKSFKNMRTRIFLLNHLIEIK